MRCHSSLAQVLSKQACPYVLCIILLYTAIFVSIVVYLKNNYTTNHMFLVGAGGVDHSELVKAAEKLFSTLVSLNPIPLGHKAH